MTEALASDLVVEPAAVAAWLGVEPEWVAVVGEVRAWLRRPTL
ncbi:MAG: hypothetical protein QOH30_3472, partial [Baekduia sp.]|nr:hypothetical protein [Baekduia sp.]